MSKTMNAIQGHKMFDCHYCLCYTLVFLLLAMHDDIFLKIYKSDILKHLKIEIYITYFSIIHTSNILLQ